MGGIRGRHEQRRHHARERGVHAGLEHAHPERSADEDVGRNARNAGTVQDQQRADRDRSTHERQGREVAGVEQRDDHDRTEIVEHGQRQQENLEAHRHAVAEQRQQAERESDVGCRRNGPAADADRIVPVQRGVDRRGHDHATECGDSRQCHLAALREFARDHLALDLEPDQQEEDRHQQVVDPDQQRLVELERADLQLDRRLQQGLVVLGERRVRGDHGEHARDHEQDAARGLELEEIAQRGDGAGIVAVLGHGHAWRKCRAV